MSEQEIRPHIRIHPPGTRQTDYAAAENLSRKSPLAFVAVQNLLTAVDDHLHSERSGLNAMQQISGIVEAYTEFIHCLEEDHKNYDDKMVDERRTAIEYLSVVSDIFPNWQDVYTALDDMIWNLLGMTQEQKLSLELIKQYEKLLK